MLKSCNIYFSLSYNKRFLNRKLSKMTQKRVVISKLNSFFKTEFIVKLKQNLLPIFLCYSIKNQILNYLLIHSK